MDTPVFESSDLFHRSVGAGTDIMDKETYTFLDRGGDSLTLRPEGTAPVCRAFLEAGMHSLPQPVRLYYFCPVFRYDRPQAGRYRQHHQYGVEILGDGSPLADAEIVDMGWTLTSDLGLTGLSLFINSIGDGNCRPGYIDALRSYYQSARDDLCSDCRQRWEHNPLRLLDCKRDSCRPLQESAPRSTEHLCDECEQHWSRLQTYLNALDIPYTIDHRLVRGLDYYTRTVFEIVPPGAGAQGTILGGGRYDGLIEQLGGRPTPGVGFATGMERLILNVQGQGVEVADEEKPTYYIAALGEEAVQPALELAAAMRRAGVGVIQGAWGRSMRGQMRNANSLGVSTVLIIGEDEAKAGTVTAREMGTREQKVVAREEFLSGLNA
jgi:histidyl-tRNA synthetase